MSIKIRISATAAGVKKTFNSMKNQAKSTGTAIKNAFSGIGSKIAGMIGIAAVTAAVRTATSHLDALKKSADNLNMDTDEFQRFSHAAQLAGSSAKEFEVGTVNMFRTLGRALDGMGGDIEKFQRLGIDPEQLRGKESAEQLGMVYDALNAIEDPTRRVSVAMELFGRSGRRVAGLAANWRELKKETEDLLISKEHLEAVEAYNDALTQLQGTIAKLVVESDLIPFLTSAVKWTEKLYSKSPSKDNATIMENAKRATMVDVEMRNIRNEREAEKENSFFGWTWKVKEPTREEAEASLDKKYPGWRERDARLEKERKENEERKRLAAEAAKIKEQQERVDFARDRAEGRLGNLSADEKALMDRAKSVQDVIKAEKEITAERSKQAAIQKVDQQIQDTIADYQQEFKWKQMTLKGLEKQVAIEKALAAARKTANRELTEAEIEDLSKSAGAVFDINKKMSTDSTDKTINTPDFKGDSVLSMGGMIGSQAQFSRSRDELLRKQFRVQQELYNRVNELNNKMPNRYENQGARF